MRGLHPASILPIVEQRASPLTRIASAMRSDLSPQRAGRGEKVFPLPLPVLHGERVGVRGFPPASSLRFVEQCASPLTRIADAIRPLPAKSGERRKALSSPSPRSSRGEGGVRGFYPASICRLSSSVPRPSPGSLTRSDLSPQRAGRGEKVFPLPLPALRGERVGVRGFPPASSSRFVEQRASPLTRIADALRPLPAKSGER
ncbi:hypothetical protein CI1B_13250 [Bradyrhizobium ivorense]|uniref:Uncharacterized protein n=1 Tax=Bradyrhizobium ivorense TaxID=2511166 RepID=A0A508STN2_9BRAD|nr:hypothetical protein CI1B_13250 [Bradyrhizobium ivorense]